jgi:hypothetical protein
MKWLACAALVLCACGGKAQQQATHETNWTVTAAANDTVVAQVAGTPILASQLAAHAKATGLEKRPALADLVRQELLAHEARRRGYDQKPDVDLARREEMVRLFVARDFGASHADPSVIPEADLRQVYERYHEYFIHDRLAKVWNVCTSPETARAIYDDAKAHPPKDAEAFDAIVKAHGAHADNIVVEETSLGYQEKWRKALFGAVHKPGDLMLAHLPDLPFPCTDHVAWAQEYSPARHDSFEQARDEVAQKAWDTWRERAFGRWLTTLVREHQIEMHAENLPHD